MNVAVYCRNIKETNLPYIVELLEHIQELGWKPVLEHAMKEELLDKINLDHTIATFKSYHDFKNGIGLIVSLGGDGTFIKSVNYIRDSNVPIIGINTGRLGFLANVPKDSMREALEKIKQQKFEYQNRTLLEVETNKNHFGDNNFALNEVTVSRRDSSAMLTVHTSIDDEYLNSYWADGLIVSTPTGSTAYSLACGGPIIEPECELHVITPIAPHNLNVRPFVVSDDKVLKLSVEGRGETYLLSLDGKSVAIEQHEEVIIKKAQFMIRLVKIEGHEFVDTIRNKMLWGLDRRNL